MTATVVMPDRVPIRHEPGYRTGIIGSYADRQFLASVCAGFPDGVVVCAPALVPKARYAEVW
jgi:hypothetical protein